MAPRGRRDDRPAPAGWAALLEASAGLVLTANALRPVGRRPTAVALTSLGGWTVSELPLLTLAGQVATTAAALRRGVWRRPAGRAAVAAQALSAGGLVALEVSARRSAEVLEAALVAGLGPGYRQVVDDAGLTPPEVACGPLGGVVPPRVRRRDHLLASGVPYGPAGSRNLLDVWGRRDRPGGGVAPVVIQVPGGAWVSGDTRWQAYPLMARLVRAGWLCVPISYRLSPGASWPDQLVDVKRAIGWVKAHIAELGGDPGFVAITGGSAGGHLSALAALSANHPSLQPGFEDVDTAVQAAVPLYGVYDLADWDGRGGPATSIAFVERTVLKTPRSRDPRLWRAASPISWVGRDAPPVMLVH
ncbi:MAG TPA: alpha/beta hydrolase, partial [Acidimicrobiales bacterium]|nr:alpha/beta hydrolase [Acidimicrobiales bacterium]